MSWAAAGSPAVINASLNCHENPVLLEGCVNPRCSQAQSAAQKYRGHEVAEIPAAEIARNESVPRCLR